MAAPLNPSSVTLSASLDVSSYTVDITWPSSVDATGYSLSSSTSLKQAFTELSSGITGLSYSDSDVASGVIYYRLAASNADGESAFLLTMLTLSGSTVSEYTTSYVPSYTGDGWSTIPTMTTGRGVYVDATSGSDSNDGLSEAFPKQTIAAGVALMRSGYDDHLYLKRGENWGSGNGINLGWSGKDADHPSVITSYGDENDPPPIVDTVYNALNVGDGTCSYTWFVDIELTEGFRILAGGTDIRLEGVVVPPGENDAFVLNGIDGPFTNITLHRCVAYGRYPLSSTGHVQGLYFGNVHGAVISECIFDENGWSSEGTREGDGTYGPATIFNHNLYIQYDGSDIEVKKLWSSRASSHGIQLRTGGVLEDSIFYGNPINILIGSNISGTSHIRRNAAVKGVNINSTTTRGWFMEVTTSDFLCEIHHNIGAHKSSEGTGPVGLRVSDASKTTVSGIVSDNILYKWNYPIEVAPNVEGYSFLRNHIQNETQDIFSTYPDNIVSSVDNLYYTTDADGTRFRYNGSNVTDASWKSSVGDSGSTLSSLSGTYPDPEKDMDGFSQSIGLSSAEDLLHYIRSQRKGNWDIKITPDRIVPYFRSNFGMIPYPSTLSAVLDGFDVVLTWDEVPGANSYKLARETNGGGYTVIDSPTSGTLTYTDVDPGIGDIQNYKILATIDSVDGDYSPVVSITSTLSALSLSATINGDDVDLTWDPSGRSIDGYEIQRKTDDGAWETIAM